MIPFAATHPCPILQRRLVLVAALLLCMSANANQTQQSDTILNPNQAVSTSASLDFTINIGKFVFFRIGTGAYPTASGTVDTVTFALQPTIPAGATTPTAGSNKNVSWNGVAPTLAATSTTSLPVEVRSNAGQISLTAAATSLLTSGSNTIPFSQVQIATNNSGVPAPTVPNSGVSAAVAVTSGASFGGLVTQASANWTFSFNGSATPTSGTYNGQITFTATSP
jgi:hypothetical protein